MTKCPNCGREDAGHASNQMTSVPMSIPVEMLLSVRHALMIGGNTSRMSSHRKEEQGFDVLKAELARFIPDGIKDFDDNDWVMACERVKTGESLRGKLIEKRKSDFSWGEIEGYYAAVVDENDEILVKPGRSIWPELTDEDTAKRHVEQVNDLLDQLAPLEPAIKP